MEMTLPAATDALQIRRADERDAALLAEMGEQTFCDNFAHLYSREDLESFLAVTYSEEIQRRELQDASNTHFIAYYENKPAGFVKIGPCKLPVDSPPMPAYELHRIYILEPYQGLQIGHRFMDLILEEVKLRKAGSFYLGAWENNHRAHAFYRRYGFEKVGEYKFPVGNHTDQEFIFRLQK